jgi:hypothetical protein
MRVRRTGRAVHDRIIEVKKNLPGLFSYPIKFKGRQQPPLNADDIKGGKSPVNSESSPP